MNYTVHHNVIDPKDIINLCDPEYLYLPKDWNQKEELIKRKHKQQKYIELFNKEIGFYDKLEKSILQEGFRNPILVTSNNRPTFRLVKEIPPNETGTLFCELLGGSRLMIAKKHQIPIPCIISDFLKKYQTPILTIDEILYFFKDKPQKIVLTTQGVRCGPSKHMHLTPNLRDEETIFKIRKDILSRI